MELIKWFLFFIGLGYSHGLTKEAKIIIDVIKSYEKPTAVNAKICWGLSDKINFATEVMKTDNAGTIQFIEQRIYRSSAEKFLIVVDLNCNISETFLAEASRYKMFARPFRWILISNSTEQNTNMISLALNNLLILIDSEVIVMHKISNKETILQKVYKIDSAYDYIFEPFATWTVANGLNIYKETSMSLAVRRKNLRNHKIRMSIVNVDGSNEKELNNLNNLMVDDLAKSAFHSILPLLDYMNATKELFFTDTWGYYVNNTWTGMTGQMLREEADLCGSVILMRDNRVPILSFMTQPIPVTARFVFREPPLSLQNNLFYLPFRSTVWISMAALLVLIWFILYIFAKWEMKITAPDVTNPLILRPDISDIGIFIVSAVVQQGSDNVLKGRLGRAVIFIMFLSSLFFFTSYSANIVALLQSSSDDIHTLSDLLNSKLEMGVEDTPYSRHYFTTATDRVRKAIYDKIAKTGHKPNFMDVVEGVKRLQNAEIPFAFHMNLGRGYKYVEKYFQEEEKCGLQEIEYITNAHTWTCCRKHSPFEEIYKVGLARIIEHGIGKRMYHLIFNTKPSCIARGGSFGSVNTTDIQPILQLLLYGMLCSILLLGLEILYYKRQVKIQELKRSDVAGNDDDNRPGSTDEIIVEEADF